MEPNRKRSDSEDSMFLRQQASARRELVAVTFANPLEGTTVDPYTSPEELDVLREQYRARHHTATLYHFPEGYEFIHTLADGQHYSVVLITPPDLIAEQHADGTWTRRARTEQDGPESITEDWYINSYLADNHLPAWFMRPAHTDMLRDDFEARRLWPDGKVPAPTIPPPSDNYLATRYPTVSMYPHHPEPQTLYPGQIVAYECSDEEIARLAKAFPAVYENSRRGERTIYISATGKITVRRAGSLDTSVQVLKRRADWYLETDRQSRASYQLSNLNLLTAPPPVVAPANRDAELDRARALNGFPDIGQLPEGDGRWAWLNQNVDGQIAQVLGYNNPIDVALAEENGALQGLPLRNRPRVVFFPEMQHFDIAYQPAGPGRWAYFTNGEGSARELAYTNLGNLDYVFDNNPHPSAAQVWRYRQQVRAAGGYDPTEGIEIVWVPATGDHPMADPTPEPSLEGPDYGVDPISGLPHDPTNNGENDQTTVPGTEQYQTIKINGKNYTLDRARAHAGNVEPHKSWCNNAKGVWKQYEHYDEIDWTDPHSVELMNKWREQAARRAKYQMKRHQQRPTYPEEQKDMLFGYVKKAKGGQPEISMEKITKIFNKRFNEERNVRAILSLYYRLCKQYKDNGGERVKTAGRGGNKKKEKEERQKQAEKDLNQIEESDDEAEESRDYDAEGDDE
ncbi:hypothetical protein LTR37_000519 [Vermiconidia calcicola]|uniref:Uncharacterized protein n=1 Tax=Vermiconidia calcicola TaxID=1690605 RepID=A0ACC3NYK5_9PEZI|nr:hypothetical protein LTR37_000519 [Vermiconidia calcicola]